MTPTEDSPEKVVDPPEPVAPGEAVSDASRGLRVKVAEEGPVVRTLAVEVEAGRVDRAFDEAYRDLGRQARIKGFRPGKVPRGVLERMYGPTLPGEIERRLVGETLPAAIEMSGHLPLVEPDVDAKPPCPGEPFAYTVRLEVRPAIALPELAGLPGKRPSSEVGEAEVEAQLEALRERNARLVEEPEGTAAENGHVVKIDFQGRIDGELFEGGSGEAVEVELGSDRFIPGFEAQLAGAREGEDRTLEVSFPDDYGAEDLRGKQASFSVQMGAVCRREKPELDDEFAKDLGDFGSVADLQARIREDLEKEREGAADAALRRSVLDALIDLAPFEVGSATVDRQLEAQLASLQQRFAGQVPEDVMREQLARAREEGRPTAERRVRERFLLDEVATCHEIEIGDEELGERIEAMAAAQGVEAGRLERAAREQGWLEAVRAELREERALAYLVDEASVEEPSAA